MSDDKKRNALFGITVRRFIEGKHLLGFKGDNRGPSLSFKVGYRTAASIFFDLAAGKQFRPIVGSSSGTEIAGTTAIADVSTKGSFFIGNKNSVHGRIRTSGSNPFIPGSPDIDTVLTFKAVISGDVLTISGHLQGDSFPGTEVIIDWKDGREFLITHDAEGGLPALSEKYLKELGIFTKKYIVDEDGYIIKELPFNDPRYKEKSNTLFDKGNEPTIDVYLPPVTQAFQSEEVKPILHYNDLLWRNDEPTIDEVVSEGDGVDDMYVAALDEPVFVVDEGINNIMKDSETNESDSEHHQKDSHNVQDTNNTKDDNETDEFEAKEDMHDSSEDMSYNSNAMSNNESDEFDKDEDEPDLNEDNDNETDEFERDEDEPDLNEDNNETDTNESDIHEEPSSSSTEPAYYEAPPN